ncbi:MAG: [citrate (pro-3S)-lyase] ligase [Bacteroidales bacterium]|jgi:cytidyltransferase-like protein|nr:[citrate (pro-3S)-lyase] ligase [Bacteroidales bacterium]
MMQSYSKHNIQELPLSSQFFRKKVESFLGENGLRMEELDVYCVIENEAGNILAGAGLSSDIIKCIAVAPEARSEGLVAPLVSHLISLAASKGMLELKLFTKPENQAIFESLGFRVLARAPKAILMENGHGLERYCNYLKGYAKEGRSGVIVMNANPFTLGHLYLLQQASQQVDNLYVIPVKEDKSQFSYEERLSMIRASLDTPLPVVENYFSGRDPKNQFPTTSTGLRATVCVLEGSDYQISAATFPTYFLKNLSDAAETQMRLDLDLFARWIAPALNASVRFVGSEPLDPLTARYNDLMRELLPEVVELPRYCLSVSETQPVQQNYFSGRDPKNQFCLTFAEPTHTDTSDRITVSASEVRKALEEGSFKRASALCPETTWPYLMAELAQRALRLELDTPGKPGLVGPDSCGAHKDMDYSTMLKGIAAIRPFFPKMAMAASAQELRDLGIEAEKAMLAATGGVNTHRGAIFCMGLALNACGDGARMAELAEQICGSNRSRGARTIALSGYKQLFEDWLPYYESGAGELKTLLRIMSTLDDTCVIKRAGADRAQLVKQEASAFSSAGKDLCERYAAEGISPGGAADMLALTIFIHSIII